MSPTRDDLLDQLASAQLSEVARVDANRHAAYRADAERLVHITHARVAMLKLRQRIGDSSPQSWRDLIAEALGALEALAPKKEAPAAVVPLRRVR